MSLAHEICKRSTCKRTRVGCVITSKNLESVYSVGYNGTAKGLPNDECRVDDVGNCGDIHAEVNAMVKIPVKDDHKIFFITISPCEVCAKLIVNSGAWKVYIAGEYRIPKGNKILAEAGIGVEMMYAIVKDGKYITRWEQESKDEMSYLFSIHDV